MDYGRLALLLLLLVLVYPSSNAYDFEHCKNSVKQWASSSLDSDTDNGHILKDLLFFLHVPRTGGRTYFHCFLKKLYSSSLECPRSYDKLRFNPRKPGCRLLVTHDDYSMVSKLPGEKTSVVTILRDPIERVFSAYEFSIEVGARFLVHPNMTSLSKMSGRVRSKSGGVSTLEIWPWKYLVPWMTEDLFSRRDARKRRGPPYVYGSDSYDMEEIVMPLHEYINHPVAMDLIHNGATFQVAGLTNNSNIRDAHELRQCVITHPSLGKYVLEVAKKRLDDMLYVGITEDQRQSATMFANVVGAQVISQLMESGIDNHTSEQSPSNSDSNIDTPDDQDNSSSTVEAKSENMTVGNLMENYETCVSSLRSSQSQRRTASLKRLSPANFTKEALIELVEIKIETVIKSRSAKRRISKIKDWCLLTRCSLGIYYLSIFKASETILNSMKSLRSRFFWGGSQDSGNMACWFQVLSSFEKGGLQIGSLMAFNLALLQKWRWRLLSSPHNMWVNIIKALHGQEGGLNNQGCGFNGTWSRIIGTSNFLHSKGIIPLNSFCFKVGCGTRVRFWKDIWIGNSPLHTRYNRLLYRLDQDKDCLIIDRIVNGQWQWNWFRSDIGTRNMAYLNDLLLEISQIDISVDEETCTWVLSNDGTFSVKSARRLIDSKLLSSISTPTVWDKFLPRKVSSVDVVDIDEFCLYDLKEMIVKLEMTKYVKDNKIILVYVEHRSSNVDSSIFVTPKKNLTKEWEQVSSKALSIGEITRKQMIDHVGNGSTIENVVDYDMLYETEGVGPMRNFKEAEHDELFDDDEHILEDNLVSMNNFNLNFKHDLSIAVVEVHEHDLDVIDYDSFNSDLDDEINSKRIIQLRELKRIDKAKTQSQ
uniref:Protein-tyrosine sulfotransferase-like n=1 Tax=Tanacetum cinerariifolium TaxID=118510 RepID=A0A6L2NYZ9_TANCI|nr:protein-tyrosine sulfotransferase-like [Tanacetum cinerariifolium]